ncbi:adenylate/guanylate cyclase domain-containing protein, partial [bacterium]|nr:adenylate/guanylate cyclase domain-containing protein [bacterium]
ELINVGVGISTGEGIAGGIGTRRRMDYTVIGDSVNLAERIESVSKHGQVYISEKTYFQVKDSCIVRTLDPIKLKGREKAVPVYEVLAIK